MGGGGGEERVALVVGVNGRRLVEKRRGEGAWGSGGGGHTAGLEEDPDS